MDLRKTIEKLIIAVFYTNYVIFGTTAVGILLQIESGTVYKAAVAIGVAAYIAFSVLLFIVPRFQNKNLTRALVFAIVCTAVFGFARYLLQYRFCESFGLSTLLGMAGLCEYRLKGKTTEYARRVVIFIGFNMVYCAFAAFSVCRFAGIFNEKLTAWITMTVMLVSILVSCGVLTAAKRFGVDRFSYVFGGVWAGAFGILWLGGITSIQNSFVAATVLALVLHMVNGIISRKDVGKTAPSEAGSTAA